ncbi:MAG: helix-turn-helix transcriptional regulator [Nitrospira sp.]|nr:helix-turn-helix transcriptional regulator [Nitrospira sp.]
MAVKRRRSSVVPPPPGCPLTACMQFLKGAWTPNVIWYLREGPRRFSELMADIPGVSPKVFSARLKRLEQDGIVTRQVMPTSPPTVEYSLTDLGQELTPAIDAIVQVGHKLKRRHAEQRFNKTN